MGELFIRFDLKRRQNDCFLCATNSTNPIFEILPQLIIGLLALNEFKPMLPNHREKRVSVRWRCSVLCGDSLHLDEHKLICWECPICFFVLVSVESVAWFHWYHFGSMTLPCSMLVHGSIKSELASYGSVSKDENSVYLIEILQLLRTTRSKMNRCIVSLRMMIRTFQRATVVNSPVVFLCFPIDLGWPPRLCWT